MRRSLSSLILLSSLVLGGILGPVTHLAWMRYGMDDAMMEHGSASLQTVDSRSSLADEHHGEAIPAADGSLLLPGVPCAEECLFLVLLASQASGLAPGGDELPVPEESPTVWLPTTNEVDSASLKPSSARDPPRSA